MNDWLEVLFGNPSAWLAVVLVASPAYLLIFAMMRVASRASREEERLAVQAERIARSVSAACVGAGELEAPGGPASTGAD